MGKSLKRLGTTSGEKAQNVEFFATDIEPNDIGTLRVNLSGDNVLIQITKDSGSTWLTLGTPAANADTNFFVAVSLGDAINFRTNDAGGFTSDFVNLDFTTMLLS